MANPFLVSCPVWGFVHTRFQISNKEFVIISMKDISGQLELKYIKAKNLKIKRSRFCGDHVLFGSHSVDSVFGSLVVAIIFLLFRWLVPFLFTVFIEAFLLDLTGLFFRRNHYSTVFDCDCRTSREFNGLFMLRALGCQKLEFHWSAAWLSWPPLWWGVISF